MDSKDHSVCVMTPAEVIDVCGANLENTTVRQMKDYKKILFSGDLIDARTNPNATDKLAEIVSKRLVEYKRMQTVTTKYASTGSDDPPGLVRVDSPRKSPLPSHELVSRVAYDWFQELQGLVAYAMMKPGRILEECFQSKIMTKGPYNALHFRIEADMQKKFKKTPASIIKFVHRSLQVPTEMPLYIAHSGSIDSYRKDFADVNYTIVSKTDWAPEILNVTKGHRELLAFFEQLVLFHSEFFVGTSVSSMSFYVMAGRTRMEERHSLDYLPRGRDDISCCRGGIPYDSSTHTVSNVYKVREIYNIALWGSPSDGSATGGSAIFMNLLMEEFKRRGHRNQYPAKLLPNYLKAGVKGENTRVIMRSDGPFILHRRKVQQDEQLLKTVIKYCDILIFQSEWSRRATEKYVAYYKKVPSRVQKVVIGNAADPFNFFPPTQQRHIPSDGRLRIGTSVWSTAERKNFDLIQKLVPFLDPNVYELVIVGRVPDEFDKTLFDERNFTIFPPMNQRELGIFLRTRVDAFLAPSWFECFSNSEVQASTSGLPIIALNESSHVEVARSGGVFFGSHGNHSDITGALEAIQRLRSEYDTIISQIDPPSIRDIARQYLEAGGLVG
ncbi:MAG: hypothetical protein SGBAC_013025 [Bacillariaceae sp.]